MTKQLFTLLLTTVAFPGLAPAADEINCTASPECATLGYTQTNCPKGGIRCPFDKTKMFCVSGFGGEDFSFKNTIYQYQIVFADGSTGTYYDDTKDPIGIITYVHPNGQSNHGLIMSLDQPSAQNRDFAVQYCANYTTKGTKVGDWHLADIGEIGTMQNGDEIDNNTQFSKINSVLKTIPGAQALGASFSYYYGKYCSSDTTLVDCNASNDYLYTCDNRNYTYSIVNCKKPGAYIVSWKTDNEGWYLINSYKYRQGRYDEDGTDDYAVSDNWDFDNWAPGVGGSGDNVGRKDLPLYYSSYYFGGVDVASVNTQVVDLNTASRFTIESKTLKGHFRCVAYL